MKLRVDTQLNERQTVSMELDGAMDECLRGVNAMLAYKGSCGLCGNTDVLLQTKVAKGFNFIEFVCTKCGAKAQWGSYKDGGYFLKNWEKYEGKSHNQEPTPEELAF